MAVSFTVSVSSPQPLQALTLSVTGGAATTGYIAEIGTVATLAALDGGTTIDDGRHQAVGTGVCIPFTTDGSGNATLNYTPQVWLR